MDFNDILSKLDAMLAPTPRPQMVKMTTPQFEAYVADQLAKAKSDYEEEDKEKGAKKAQKRLSLLRDLIAHVAKVDFGQGAPGIFGDEGTSVPIYTEDDITRFAEMSESEQATPPAPGGLMADGRSFSDARGAQDFSKALNDLQNTISSIGKESAPKPPPAPQTESFDWPRDLAMTEEVIGKEALAKRAPVSWGKDTTPSR